MTVEMIIGNRSVTISFLFSFFTAFSFAQDQAPSTDTSTKDTVEYTTIDRRVKVVTTYRPSVSDAYKINSLPQVQDTLDVTPSFEYSIVSSPIETEYSPDPIQAASMKGEPLDKLYKSMLTVGFGNYLTSLADVKINTLRSKSHQAGLHIHHYSSQGAVKLGDGEKSPAGYSTNSARFQGKKFMNDNHLFTGVSIARDGYRHYGYDTRIDSTLDKKDIGQRYIMADAGIGIQSDTKDSSKLKYLFSADYALTQEVEGYLENVVSGKVSLTKYFEEKSGGLDLKGGYFGTTGNGLDSAQYGFVEGTPWAGIRVEQMRIKAGVSVGNVFGNGKAYVFPKIDFSYYIIDDILVPYAKIDGGCKLNTYREISKENPFIVSGLQVDPTQTKIKFIGGVKGKFGKGMPFNISASYADVKDQYLFVNDVYTTDSMQNKFGVVYDDMEVINAHAEMGVISGEKLSFVLTGDYWHYAMATEDKAWHMPTMEIGLTAKYNIQNKIIASANLVYSGERYAKSYVLGINEYTLKPIVDANLGLEYRYTKILSAFLNFNNLAAQQYNRWNFYPGQRFSVLAGITYAL